MSIDLSAIAEGSNSNQNNSDNSDSDDNSDKLFDSRIEGYETERERQSIRRFMQHVCDHFGIDKKEDVGRSEWADLYDEYSTLIYDNDEGIKAENENLKGNLHKYKQQFEEPEGDYDEYNEENADEKLNIEGISEQFADDYDSIFLPEDFEVPTELYYKKEVEVSAEFIADEISKSAESAKGIGNGTLENFEDSVQENVELLKAIKSVDLMKDAIENSDELDFEEIVAPLTEDN